MEQGPQGCYGDGVGVGKFYLEVCSMEWKIEHKSEYFESKAHQKKKQTVRLVQKELPRRTLSVAKMVMLAQCTVENLPCNYGEKWKMLSAVLRHAVPAIPEIRGAQRLSPATQLTQPTDKLFCQVYLLHHLTPVPISVFHRCCFHSADFAVMWRDRPSSAAEKSRL